MVAVNALSAFCLAAFVAVTSAVPEYDVGFENSAYSVGETYDGPNQREDWDTLYGDPVNMSGDGAIISSDEASSGSRSLRIRYPANEREIHQSPWELNGARTYYLSYRLFFEEDFEFNGQGGSDGGKLPGLAGSASDDKYFICSGGRPCGSGRGFSARLMWRTDGLGELYLYDVSNPNKYGDRIEFDSQRTFKKGAWQTITQKVTLNRPGSEDGSIKVWLDGEVVVDVQGRKIVDGDEQVDTLYFSTFHGGSDEDWTPGQEQFAYFDDFVVSEDDGDVRFN